MENFKKPFDGTPSDPKNSDKHQSKVAHFVFKRPRHLLNTCPISTTTEHFPRVEENSNTKKLPLKKKEVSCSNLTSEWLNRGVSLPKPKTTKQRPDAGEPYANTQVHLPLHKAPDSSRISSRPPSDLSSKCPPCEEDDPEDQKGDYHYSVGPSECLFSFRVPSSELVFDDVEIPEEVHEPSHALQNWEMWTKKWKNVQENTCVKLKRKPYDLVVNQTQYYRKVNEDKALLTYAQIPKADKWRGHPYFWRTSPTKDSCDLNPAETDVTRGILPVMEFVDVPRVINIEKGCIHEDVVKVKDKFHKGWDESSYRKEREEFLKGQYNKMKPNEIHADELVVTGKRVCPSVEVEPSTSVLSIDIPIIRIENEEDVVENQHTDDRKSIACLVINGEEISRQYGTKTNPSDSNKVKDNYTFLVEFGTNKMKTLYEKTITVENKGTMVIAYHWTLKKPKPKISLDVIKPGPQAPWFFFNKNSGIILPGQIQHLKFYHYGRHPGNRTEIWFLTTSPDLFETPESCKIVLTAVIEDDKTDAEIISLKRYLRMRVGETIAKELVDEMTYNATYPTANMDHIEYRCFFMERELFEIHNPKHYYHSRIITELRDIFDSVAGTSQEEWDLSISTLMELIMRNTSGQAQQVLLSRISEISRKLFRPNYLRLKKEKNHRMAYQILCSMTSCIEDDYWYLKRCLSKRRRPEKHSYRHRDFDSATSEEYGGENEEPFALQCSFTINALNLKFFQTMFYLKVYHRICKAAENVADVIETNKFLEPIERDLQTTRFL